MSAKLETNIADIAAQIEHHDELYWKKNVIEISDADYDVLRARLKSLAPDHPVLLRTGEEIKKNEETVRHAVPMLSIEKSLVPGEIETWAKDDGAFTGTGIEDGLVAAYKVDGSSCSLVYENGNLIQAATRGDGKVGNLITRNVLQIAGLPHQLSHAGESGRVEIRGEIYMSRASFANAVAHFERLLAEGKAKEDERPPNARNYCAGSLMQKDPRDVAQRGLSFMAHGCVGAIPGADGISEAGNFRALKTLGFETPFYKHVTDVSQIALVEAEIDAQRDALPYDTDGVVFTINKLALHVELGATSHHPRYKIAFKYGREQGETTVAGFEWETSRSGRVCPTMIVEPIHLGGATVSRCTAHNAKRVKESNIAVGDRVLLEREVIPHFVKKVSGVESNAGTLPTVCPSCGTELSWDETETNLVCPNLGGCKSQLQDFLEYYVARKAANIDGVGEEWIKKMLDAGLVTTPADYFTVTEEQLLALRQSTKTKRKEDKKTIERTIVENIAKAREQSLEMFLVCLGIKGLGTSVSAKLANHFGTLDKVIASTPDDLMKIEGIAETMAAGIVNGLKNRAALIAALKERIVIKEVVKVEGHLSGKSFCLTGHIEFEFDGTKYDARPDIEALIVSKGGTIKSVSKKLNYLVAGDEAGSKLEKAQNAGVSILDAAGLVAMLKG
ncbi:MAG: NAD-dependent DNA ligase LigA [Planctomycetota bacterium]